MTFIDPRLTERRNPRSADIDLATPLEIVDLINAEDQSVPDAVASQREAIARAIEQAESTFRNGGRLFYVGAGTSGRLGVLDASECPPTYGTDPEMVQGIIAGGHKALTRSQEGAEDRLEGAIEDLTQHGVRGGDFVIGIAASGTTPYVRRALTYARSIGAATGLVACSPPPQDALDVVDILIQPLTGPGDRHRLDAHEGGHRDQACAQHDHDRRHDSAGQNVRQSHGRPSRDERQAAGS
jgi:N-acetylmuramic acid 6-phosphate etherase